MKTYISEGRIVQRTAPAGGVTVDVPVVIGSEFLIPIHSVSEGVRFSAIKQGKVWLPAKTGESWTEGAKVYWNPTQGYCEASDNSDNYCIGTADGNQVNGKIAVILSGHALASGGIDLEAKADKVAGAVAGNLASLSAGGNLNDAGIPATDVVRVTGSIMNGLHIFTNEAVTDTDEDDVIALSSTTQVAKITTKPLETEAGGTYSITVTHAGITTIRPAVATLGAYAGTTGKPRLVSINPSMGQFTIIIENIDETDVLNGAVDIYLWIG